MTYNQENVRIKRKRKVRNVINVNIPGGSASYFKYVYHFADELGIEEPRGTAAALGEGDVFIHSQQDHGTGGHWCAKIIFFSLLAVLITLIGLIILENRGLSECKY